MPIRPGSDVPRIADPPPVHLLRSVDRYVAAREVRAGRWVRVRSGAWTPAPAAGSWTAARNLALARIAAVSAQLEVEHVVSHQSAALLWGLPMIDDGAAVHVVQRTASHRRGSADVSRHEHQVAPDDVVTLQGRQVTSLARTLVDCATHLRPRAALVLADAGLRAGADRAKLAELVAGMVGHRGVARARLVLNLADDGAESAGESMARHLMLRAGFPVPQTQVHVQTCDGPAWGDLGWPAARVLAEYDGAAKYTAAGDAADAVLAERRREVALERAGWRTVRITAHDLRRAAGVLTQLATHLPRGPIRTLL